MHILIVEDDHTLRDGLVDLVAAEGHDVEAVSDGDAAVERGTAVDFDLVILDVMLPKLSGVEACRKLRRAKPQMLVLMLTARSAEGDKVEGLDAGADDYMTKPFGARELLARIHALGRRARATPAESDVLEIDGVHIDLGRCIVRRAGEEHRLTAREVGIIRWLRRHQARAVSRAELLEQLWSVPGSLETRTVDMTIANLRKKIEPDPANPKLIVSVKGIGYAWGAS